MPLVALVACCSPAVAQDPTGRWLSARTAHFRIHARAEYAAALLPRVAVEAESAWAALARVLPAPRRTIELVVADQADYANGSAATWPVPIIVVHALPPAGDVQLHTYDTWLRLVLTHELAHAFHLDLARGWWSVARTAFGRAPFLFPNSYAPSWLTEGLAVFYESRLTAAGRLDGAWHRGQVAAGAERGGVSLGEASTPSPRWPAGDRPYAFGSTFTSWSAGRGGDSAVARLAVAMAGKAVPYLAIGGAWRSSMGVPVTDAWALWQDSVGGTEGADSLAHRRADSPGSVLTRVVVAPRADSGGRLYAVVDDGSEVQHLVVLEGATARRLARLNSASAIAPASAGGVLVTQLEWTDPYTVRSDVWLVPSGGRPERLTRGERILSLDALPEGGAIAARAVPGGVELVEVTWARGTGAPWQRVRLRPLVAAQPGVEWADPRVSPDGRHIAAVRAMAGRHDIVLLDRAGAVVRDVTADAPADLQPAFVDDSTLIWTRDIGGTQQLVTMRVSGADTQLRRCTAEPTSAYAPAPGPGGSLTYLVPAPDGFSVLTRPASCADVLMVPLSPPSTGSPSSPGSPASPSSPSPYSPFPALWPQWWFPLAWAASGGGGFAGALTAGADALGRHRYAASLALGLGLTGGEVVGAFGYQYAGPGKARFDLSVSREALLVADTAGTTSCCLGDLSADAGVTFTRRRWRSTGLLRLGGEWDRTGSDDRVGAVVSAAYSRAVTPALGISPQSGWRAGLSLRQRRRTDQDLESTELTASAAWYASLGRHAYARQVFAARVAGGTLAGDDPVQFSVGGLSSGGVAVLPGVSLGGAARTFPVRGFAPGSLIGRHVVAWSLEDRVPLALVGRGPGLFPLGLDRLSAAAFLDGALVWNSSSCPTTAPGGGGSLCGEAIASVGAELIGDLAAGYYLPLRLRLGAAVKLTSGTDPVSGYLALGASF